METMAAIFATAPEATAASTAVASSAEIASAVSMAEAGTLATAMSTPVETGLLSSIGGFFEGLSTWDYISGGLAVASGLSSIAGGNMQAGALKTQAMLEDVRARQEMIQGRREALEALEGLNKTLSINQVRRAASGLTGEGSALAGQQAAIQKGEFEMGITRDNAELNAAARRTSADQLRMDADAAQMAGYGGAVGAAATWAAGAARRR